MTEILGTNVKPEKHSRRRTGHIFRLWPLLEILLLLAVIVLFNLYTDRVGVYGQAFETDTFTPLLGERFRSFLPYLNVWWGLSLALAAAKLILGRWTPITRWADFALTLFGISVLIRLLTGGPIAQVGSTLDVRLDGSILSLSWPRQIPDLALTLERLFLALAILGTSIDALKKLLKLIAIDPDTGQFRYAIYHYPKRD